MSRPPSCLSSRLLTSFLLFAFLLIPAAAARAQILVSTFGPNLSFSTIAAYALNPGAEVCTPFVLTSNAVVSRIDTALQNNTTAPTITITARIVEDNQNSPTGPTIWTATNTAIGARSVYAFTAPAAPLQPGQTYWLVLASGGAPGFWWNSQPAVMGTIAGRNSPTASYTLFANQALPAFQIITQLGACCSPQTAACILMNFNDCSRLGLLAFSPGSACSPTACPPPACPADFNRSSTLTVQDIFEFLSAWFAGCP